MASLRAGLYAIGEHGDHPPAYPSGFASAPASLAQGIRAMLANPQMAAWVRVSPETFVDENWSEEAQGITWDGEHFITSSNGSWGQWYPGASPKALYRFRPGQYTFADGDIAQRYELGGNDKDHLGDIDYYDGWIYCAIEPEHGSLPHVLKVTAGTEPFGKWSQRITIHGAKESGQGKSFPWCAVNPWNGLLYSSPFYDVKMVEEPPADDDGYVYKKVEAVSFPGLPGFGSGPPGLDTFYVGRIRSPKVYAYDPATGAWAGEARSLTLAHAAVRIQGGCFSPNGHLYLACDEVAYVSGGETNESAADDVHLVGVNPSDEGKPAKRRTFIQCYSAFNGSYLGRTFVDTFEDNQELEGLCYAPGNVNGRAVQLHVILLENHKAAKDNVFMKPYAAPDADKV